MKLIPSSPLGRMLAAAAVSMLHIVALSNLVPAVASGWGLDGRVYLTWSITVVPGLVALAVSRTARSYWWRWPVLWMLVYASYGDWPVLILLVGQMWALWRLGKDTPRPRREPAPTPGSGLRLRAMQDTSSGS
ncbi:hypothetical protein GCG21_13620 [Pseudactinotalea sp. HY160]|uniref:hypothetical protein n=1 Tax=Pseudactinotalea sp. HY160 TaxID=2654490 RepID=UPI00128C147B|nr:hypothetical protein [Pseudactinotalea sp. HY160]MPV51025.1 hypothetical protein [Pseudactinotalea sp. HY160]